MGLTPRSMKPYPKHIHAFSFINRFFSLRRKETDYGTSLSERVSESEKDLNKKLGRWIKKAQVQIRVWREEKRDMMEWRPPLGGATPRSKFRLPPLDGGELNFFLLNLGEFWHNDDGLYCGFPLISFWGIFLCV